MQWYPYFRYYWLLWQTFLHLRQRTFDFFKIPACIFLLSVRTAYTLPHCGLFIAKTASEGLFMAKIVPQKTRYRENTYTEFRLQLIRYIHYPKSANNSCGLALSRIYNDYNGLKSQGKTQNSREKLETHGKNSKNSRKKLKTQSINTSFSAFLKSCDVKKRAKGEACLSNIFLSWILNRLF